MSQPDGDHDNLEALLALEERAVRNLAEAVADLKAIRAARRAVERSRSTARERATKRWFPPASVVLAALGGLGTALASLAHHARNHVVLAAATVTGGVALVTLPVTLPMMDASPDRHPRATSPAPPPPSWAPRAPASARPKSSRTPSPSPSPTPDATPTGTASPTGTPTASPSPSGTTPTPQAPPSTTATTPAPSTSSAPVQEQPPDQAAPPPGDQPPARATEAPIPDAVGPALVEVSLCRVNIALPPALRVRPTCT